VRPGAVRGDRLLQLTDGSKQSAVSSKQSTLPPAACRLPPATHSVTA